MKLDDFLKCKKVRCVDGDATIITTGKIYDVIGVDETFIHVIDDNGEEARYWYRRFEPVLDSAENPLQNIEITPKFEVENSVLVDNCQANIQDIGTDILDTNADIKDTPKFKVGDPVYWGLKSRIFKVYRLMTANVLEVELDDVVTAVHKDELCPATLENYGKLCSLFERIDFEAPPKELTGSDLARAMLERGDRRIYGYASDNSDNDPHGYECVVRDYDVNSGFGVIMSNARYEFFNPCDPRTGEPLTEAVLDE